MSLFIIIAAGLAVQSYLLYLLGQYVRGIERALLSTQADRDTERQSIRKLEEALENYAREVRRIEAVAEAPHQPSRLTEFLNEHYQPAGRWPLRETSTFSPVEVIDARREPIKE